ncbi:MAG: phytoene desaturase family protein [Rhizomicrobium sp.]
MSIASSYDAIVIGGGVSGLVAAAYLAKARKRVVLLEERDRIGGRCAPVTSSDGFSINPAGPALHALDPRVVQDLGLSRRGLRFAGRELPLVSLRADGKHIVLSRNVHDAVASLLPHSGPDAAAWPRYRSKLFELARAMRPFWCEDDCTLPGGAAGKEIDRIASTGAFPWLDTWFESEALKAALCYDATAGGLSLAEPGSALSLVWHASQEMSGLQGAVVIPMGGLQALVSTLAAIAKEAGCELRTNAGAASLILDENRIAGVSLSSGESCFAPLVFSTVGLSRTMSELLPPGIAGVARASAFDPISSLAEAHVVAKLNTRPQLGTAHPASRFVVAERIETYISAELAARNGEIGDELPIELVIPTSADPSLASPDEHIVSVIVRPLPRSPAGGGWQALRPVLAAKVVSALDRLIPNFSRDISHIEVLTPDDLAADAGATVSRLLTTAADRIQTGVSGLFLCGVDAEPVSAMSGRAARIAVALAGRS